jgi:hypothetical protein
MEVEPFDRRPAWQRAWAQTTAWAGKLRGILTLGAGSVVATAWVAHLIAQHGHDASRRLHLSSTRWPLWVQVTLLALAFVSGGFLTFLAVQCGRFALTPFRQRNEARNAVENGDE